MSSSLMPRCSSGICIAGSMVKIIPGSSVGAGPATSWTSMPTECPRLLALLLGNLHPGLYGKNHPRFERRRGAADVVDFHAHRVSEAVGVARAITLHERSRRGFDPGVRERVPGEAGAHPAEGVP